MQEQWITPQHHACTSCNKISFDFFCARFDSFVVQCRNVFRLNLNIWPCYISYWQKERGMAQRDEIWIAILWDEANLCAPYLRIFWGNCGQTVDECSSIPSPLRHRQYDGQYIKLCEQRWRSEDDEDTDRWCSRDIYWEQVSSNMPGSHKPARCRFNEITTTSDNFYFFIRHLQTVLSNSVSNHFTLLLLLILPLCVASDSE